MTRFSHRPEYRAAFETIVELWRERVPGYQLNDRLMFYDGERRVTADMVLRYFADCDEPLPRRIRRHSLPFSGRRM